MLIRGTFPEKGSILEHQIFRFNKHILHDRRNTSDDLASMQKSLLPRCQLCTQMFIFEPRLARPVCEDGSQNSFALGR